MPQNGNERRESVTMLDFTEYLDFEKCKSLNYGETSLIADINGGVLYANSSPPSLYNFEFTKYRAIVGSVKSEYYIGRSRFLYLVLEKNFVGDLIQLKIHGKTEAIRLSSVEANRAIELVKDELNVNDAVLMEWVWRGDNGVPQASGFIVSKSSIENGGTVVSVEWDDNLTNEGNIAYSGPQLGFDLSDFDGFDDIDDEDIEAIIRQAAEDKDTNFDDYQPEISYDEEHCKEKDIDKDEVDPTETKLSEHENIEKSLAIARRARKVWNTTNPIL